MGASFRFTAPVRHKAAIKKRLAYYTPVRFQKTAGKAFKSGNGIKALNALRSFLDTEEPQAVKWLHRLWKEQQAAITYKELRDAALYGEMDREQLEQWQREYAEFVNERLAPLWEKAMKAGADNIQSGFPFLNYAPALGMAAQYITRHGAELVAGIAAEQRDAIRAMTAQAVYNEGMTADSLAMMIRPVIGLTKPQAIANLNYCNGQLAALKELHPRMNAQRMDEKARMAAAKYAERQHMYRALNIARTELAAAYNRGAYSAVLDAQVKGLIGGLKKIWLTAADERVCPICGAMEGESINMDEVFSEGVLLPPAHPSCRCAVDYEQAADTVSTIQDSLSRLD